MNFLYKKPGNFATETKKKWWKIRCCKSYQSKKICNVMRICKTWPSDFLPHLYYHIISLGKFDTLKVRIFGFHSRPLTLRGIRWISTFLLKNDEHWNDQNNGLFQGGPSMQLLRSFSSYARYIMSIVCGQGIRGVVKEDAPFTWRHQKYLPAMKILHNMVMALLFDEFH